MSTGTLMSLEEFLAIPEIDTELELIRGEVRERPVTRRNRWHGRTETRVAVLVTKWLEAHPEQGGDVFSGEIGCILRREPPSTVGIDVAYFSRDVLDSQNSETSMIDGPPVLAVEIISPSDVQEEIDEKIEEYLACGVMLVWIVHPRHCTVTVYRPDRAPELFNIHGTLIGEPFLPGLSIPVAEIFRSPIEKA